MPTNTIDLSKKNFDKYITTFNQPWTLCLGAGICKGILPDWVELTNRIVNRCFGYNWDYKEFKKNYDDVGFSLDSWIQGSLNNHIVAQKGTVQSFNEILEEELYKDLLVKAGSYKLSDAVAKLFESPKTLTRKDVFAVCDFFEKEYSDTTLLQLVNVLLKSKEEVLLPHSVITFNADSLLYSLLVLFNIRNSNVGTKDYSYPKEPYRKILNPYQTWADNIPIFHLHGSISPKAKVRKTVKDGRDNLIFLESSYLKVAGSMYSWTQTNFLYAAQNNKLVFLGLSMSDPNIRRWLGWTADFYLKQLHNKTGSDVLSLRHLWIKTKLRSDEAQNFIDVSLHHLGVKVGLIDNWGKIGETLHRIITI
jgi:hypothetical protein